MENVSNKISGRTTILWGRVKAPVALFKTTGGEAKEEAFEKAGPSGGELVRWAAREANAGAEAAVEITASDPLASEPAPMERLPTPALVVKGAEDRPEPISEETAREQDIFYAKMSGKLWVEKGTNALVLEREIRQGIRLEESGKFIDLTEQLEEAAEDARLEEMRVVSFIRVEQIPRSFIKGSYYLGPDQPGAGKVLKALYEAMRRTNRLAVVKWTKTSRQALGVIRPDPHQEGALTVLEIEWAEVWRKPSPRATSFQEIPLSEAEIEAACDLVMASADSVASLEELRDDARVRREELRESARAGTLEEYVAPERPEESSAEDFADALRESVAL